MSTSELSDALNPNASRSRRGYYAVEYASSSHAYTYQPIVQAPQQPHVPHVSELESAIIPPAPAVAPQPPAARPQQQTGPKISDLVRVVFASQQAQEAERKRRLAWEQEQEEKAAQKQAEMEKKMLEMENVITTLQSRLDEFNNKPSPSPSPSVAPPEDYPSPQFDASPSPSFPANTGGNLDPVSPISPISQLPFQQPMFIQGSSNSPASSTGYYGPPSAMALSPQYMAPSPQVPDMTSRGDIQPQIQPMTPDPSPQLDFIERSRPSPVYSPVSSSKSKKRKKKNKTPSSSSSEDGDSSSSSSSSSSASDRPRKRRNKHDKRCYTIHHAIRRHILRMMGFKSDSELPDSYTEGTSQDSSELIRFIWDKTTKQSVHNGRMKARVLDDIKDNRHKYRHVPVKDFTKKNMDAAFEQCFVTLRQKYKVQRDAGTAESQKKREDAKARKARHLSRRKIKLTNRSEARNRIDTFEHETFDGALQADCMSSEESDTELDPQSSQPTGILKIRGYGWRSTRLLRFYSTLDDEERLGLISRPKRGTQKKERRIGPNKEEVTLPPQGVGTWMISRRWYKSSLVKHSDLPKILDKLIDDSSGFDWSQFHELGEETGDEDEASHAQADEQPFVSMHPPPPSFSSQMHTLDLDIQPHSYNPGTYSGDYTL